MFTAPCLFLSRAFLWLVISAIAVVLHSGCQTPHTFSAPTVDWQTYQGQLHYSQATGKSVIGEVVIRRAPGGQQFQFQFSSGPGFPLLKLWIDEASYGRAEGALARGSWQGPVEKAPDRLRNWFRLQEVFAEFGPGLAELRGPGWSADAIYHAGQLEQSVVSFSLGEERFAFHLNP